MFKYVVFENPRLRQLPFCEKDKDISGTVQDNSTKFDMQIK